MSECLSEGSVASPGEVGICHDWPSWPCGCYGEIPSMVTVLPKGCLTGFIGIAQRETTGWDLIPRKHLRKEKGKKKSNHSGNT